MKPELMGTHVKWRVEGMKWILVWMSIWSDGAYTFGVPPSAEAYTSEQECLPHARVLPGLGEKQGDLIAYRGYVCLPVDVFVKFALKFNGSMIP